MMEKGVIDFTVTSGQAFGGDFEAINIYSSLATAQCAGKADIIIVCQGPGNAGTDTPLGFSGIEQGVALNAASSLDATAIAVARISFADQRMRHYGLSHHTRTVLERVAINSALVPIPRLTTEKQEYIRRVITNAELEERHQFVTIDADNGFQAFANLGLEVKTMGRSPVQDREFFLSAIDAGLLAGQILEGDVVQPVP